MLFTFPSRYLFTIDLKKYLVLGHSRPGFARDFTSPVVLKICHRRVIIPFAYGAITRSDGAFQLASANKSPDAGRFVWKTTSASLATPH